MTFLYRWFRNSAIAVDLGTARTRVACGTLPVLESPSVAEGRHALRCGVVVDRDAAVTVMQPLIKATKKLGILRPRAIACVPTDTDDRERDAVIDCVTKAGAQAVYLVPEPLAALVGAGVDVSSPYAHMVLDMGDGVTDCAIIKEGRIIVSRAVRIGCCDLRNAITTTILAEWGLSVTPQTAEQILQRIGAVRAANEKELITIIGFEAATRTQVVQRIPTIDLRAALQPGFNAILGSATMLYKDIPHAWGSEIIDTGLLLCGGGSLLQGMRELIAAEIRLNVVRAEDPLRAVVRGAR